MNFLKRKFLLKLLAIRMWNDTPLCLKYLIGEILWKMGYTISIMYKKVEKSKENPTGLKLEGYELVYKEYFIELKKGLIPDTKDYEEWKEQNGRE